MVTFNDLWKFNGVTWTWVAGDAGAVDSTGNYGTFGTPSLSNSPPGRWAPASWISSNDDLYLFGGCVRGGPYGGRYSDLWKFNSSGWAWIGGPQNTGDQGSYAVQGTSSPANWPRNRNAAGFAKDTKNNFWIFGGHSNDDTVGLVTLSDLWRYDGVNWAWMAGNPSGNSDVVWGQQGVSSSTSDPGSRLIAALWSDLADNIWLFGGERLDGKSLL